MKIKLTCNWCSDEDLFNRFSRVYITKKNFNKSFTLTPNNDYDFLVIINYPHSYINFDKEKTLGVIMEPTWSPHFVNSKRFLEPLCKHILYHYPIKNPQYVFYPGLLPYHFDYDEGNDLDFYLNNTFTKHKKCSFVVSFNQISPHNSCLYNDRVKFALDILETNLDIDIYGNNWEQANINDSRIKGTVDNKKTALLDYEYSIAIENCQEEGYFTEKLTDCILTNTIPIYFGCPNIKKYLKSNPIFCLTNLKKEGLFELKTILDKKTTKNETFDKHIMQNKYNLYVAITKYFSLITS
jgi:hypothetical protein